MRLLSSDAARLERALERLAAPFVQGLDRIVEVLVFRPTSPPPPSAQHMLVRHLNIEHLGCWVYLPGRPTRPLESNDPVVLATAGRLIGIRPGELSRFKNEPGTSVLVLAQGDAVASLPFSVADVVVVAPREW